MSTPPLLPQNRVARSRRDIVSLGMVAAGALAAPRALAQAPALAAVARDAPEATSSPIVELRQYTLRSGRREPFISLFEREFIESQEAVGIRMIGGFRDLDDPDRWVWLRGFQDMPQRAQALGAFYNGDLWKAHRDEANASINDSDNVLLLRPARPGSGVPIARQHRAPAGRTAPTSAVIAAHIHYVEADKIQLFADFFETRMRPRIEALGVPVLAQFASETSANTFPRLPIREHDHVFIWFSSFASPAACDHSLARLRAAQSWRDGASDPILHQLERKPELLRLAPAARSAWRA